MAMMMIMVISNFLFVWDFRARLFSLFLGSFLGTKKAPFLTLSKCQTNREVSNDDDDDGGGGPLVWSLL